MQLELRVVSGKYKRRKLLAPNLKDVRPTKDRIREAIFSSLGNIEGYSFLDLYAGSGAMGIEALSRGAIFATFVDINKESLKCIKTNLSTLNIVDEAQVLPIFDEEALLKFKEENKQFDIIFLDPPYEKGEYIKIIDFVISNNIISKDGIIICESNKELNIDETLFYKIKKYNYGEIVVTICWR